MKIGAIATGVASPVTLDKYLSDHACDLSTDLVNFDCCVNRVKQPARRDATQNGSIQRLKLQATEDLPMAHRRMCE